VAIEAESQQRLGEFLGNRPTVILLTAPQPTYCQGVQSQIGVGRTAEVRIQIAQFVAAVALVSFLASHRF
jgi:hypothetical protein